MTQIKVDPFAPLGAPPQIDRSIHTTKTLPTSPMSLDNLLPVKEYIDRQDKKAGR